MSAIRETHLYDTLAQGINERLPDDVVCKSHERVVYNLRYSNGEDTRTNTFQTDLALFQDGQPRVIIEVKRDSASTHDLLAYDQKAERHKRVYPSLRYGMLLVETSGLTKKYLWHSNDIDFFYFSDREMDDAEDIADRELDEIAALVEEILEASQGIEGVLNGETKPMVCHKPLQFDGR